MVLFILPALVVPSEALIFSSPKVIKQVPKQKVEYIDKMVSWPDQQSNCPGLGFVMGRSHNCPKQVLASVHIEGLLNLKTRT